ncbi:Switch 2 [Hibiscus syriacus]|uniref:Switch 2 n=1 Tax=Hibiscus syriacus TaxID=106335 RepID=A0A6A3CLK6_HIBSY|nr:Switch 2 [Hibiscus syriacus]
MGYLLIVMLLCFLTSTHGYKFYVGDGDGWVVTPSENYNHWAERMRFQVNDTLFFKYNKGSDSVLLVTKEDYFACNPNPLIAVVMAVRHKPPQQKPPPASPSPSASPVPDTNAPAESPKSSEGPSDSDAGIPAPSSEQKSGSFGVVCSTRLVLGCSVLVSMALGDVKMVCFWS